jgi:hypothetical protein
LKFSLPYQQIGALKIVELSGRTWPTVRKVDRYKVEGAGSLKPKERGRASGDGRSLSAEQ